MFDKFKLRYLTEKSHFDGLGDVVKNLLYSYALYVTASTITGLFINAYFWRQTSDITLIAAFNLGAFIALPTIFYLNGILLKNISVLRLYWAGAIVQGIAAILAIFVSSFDLPQVLLYGFIFGVGSGFYWSNKNYITQKITKGSNRHYYLNFEASIFNAINIVGPVLIGWFIVFGEHINLYTINYSYRMLMIIAMILLYSSGKLLQRSQVSTDKIDYIVLKQPSKVWNYNRLVVTIFWLLGGINSFLPSILVLMLVGGGEGVFGTVQSIVAAMASMLLYVLGRKLRREHSLWVITICLSIFFVGAILFNLTYGFFGALIYTVIWALVWNPLWNTVYASTMELMDKEQARDPGLNQYSFIFDNEIFFNVGRVIGITFFFVLIYATSQEMAIRSAPLIMGLIQFGAIVPVIYLMKYLSKP